jgi:putative ABC transport system permease protein
VGAGEPVVIKVGSVTTEFFDALAVKPAIGRTFLPQDAQEGREQVVVISDQLWRSRLGADPAILGKPLALDGTRRTVIGVMPAGFDFPGATAAWTPRAITIDPRNSLLVPVLGRLKPEIAPGEARAAFDTTIASLPDGPPADRSSWNVGLLPLDELLVGSVRRPLQLFSAAVLVVLLIACANAANLLLARASGRDREIAVRAALGAGRTRLIRQLLTESLVLSVIGAAAGILLARWTVPVLLALAPAGRIPRAESVAIDPAAIVFAALVAAATALTFGLAPALRATRIRRSRTLVPAGRAIAAGDERFRASLLVAEIALALLLLTGAGLMMQSFLRLRAVDPGFLTDNVVRLSLELPEATYSTPERLQAFHQQLLARLSVVPGVAAAGLVNWLPLGEMLLNGDFRVDGAAQDPGFNVDKTAVSGGYFDAMGIRLLRGRAFNDHDGASSLPVAVVSRTVANAIGGVEDVPGRRISIWGGASSPQWLTIVGVVDDVRQLGPAKETRPAVYQPFSQVRAPFLLTTMTYVVRTTADPLSTIPAIRQALRSVDADQPASSIGLMRDVLDAATAEPGFHARLMSVFAVLALALALVGTYGVIAYSVAQRRHEIGLRVALGAARGSIVWMVLRRTMLLATAGVGLGAGAAWSLTQLLQTFLYDITPTDPATFAGVSGLIFAAALLAGGIPAGRAARVDPLEALRHE